jgi:hypothetical protein
VSSNLAGSANIFNGLAMPNDPTTVVGEAQGKQRAQFQGRLGMHGCAGVKAQPVGGVRAFLSTNREFEFRRVRQIICVFPYVIVFSGGGSPWPQYGAQSVHRLGEAAWLRRKRTFSTLHNTKVGQPLGRV